MRQHSGRLLWCILAVVIMVPTMLSVGQAQTTTRVDLDSQSDNRNGSSYNPTLSADGRFVAFEFWEMDLLTGTQNGISHIFVYDQKTEITMRVSGEPVSGNFNHRNISPAISADGRFVAFSSSVGSLVAGDENGDFDIFVYNRETEATNRVSVDLLGEDSNGRSDMPRLSADGRYVTFLSEASNLVEGDENEETDVFVYDREMETTTRVSIDSHGGDPNGPSFSPALSADGRYVSFMSLANNLVDGDGNGTYDIFVYDRETKTTTRVSVDSHGGDPNGYSYEPTLNANGRFVAFGSSASNLVDGDGNGTYDIFVYDRQTELTTRVSVDPQGGDSDGYSSSPALSADGRFVAFNSSANNLVVGDGNGTNDIFVFDRQTELTTRVSVDQQGEDSDTYSFSSALSADGQYVSFVSWSGNMSEKVENGDYKVYIRDRGPAVIGPAGIRDLDGSGTADLLWRNSRSGEVAVWLMEGARMGASSTLGGVSQDWKIAGSGDVDGNGTADVIWRNMKSGVVAIWMMKGSRINSIGFPGSASNDWEIKGVGDVDGDEKVDIFWQNTTSGQVSVWRMDGSIIVSTGLFNAPPSEEKLAGIGDTNADGKADVFWFNTRTGKVTIWQMDGLSISFVGFPGTTSQNWAIQSVGDIDGNGTADVVWRHRTNGVVAAWLLQGSAIISSRFFDGVPLEWGMVQLGDVDGNGTADVIWRHSISGAVAVWMMNGLSISSVEFPGSLSTDWVLAGH